MPLLSNEILEVAIDRYYTENLSENFSKIYRKTSVLNSL